MIGALFAIAIIALLRGHAALMVVALVGAIIVQRYYGLVSGMTIYMQFIPCPCILRAYRRAFHRHTCCLCLAFLAGVATHWGASAGWWGFLSFMAAYLGVQLFSPWKLNSMVRSHLLAHHIYAVLNQFPHAIPLVTVHPGPPFTDMRVRVVLTKLMAFRIIEIFKVGQVPYIRLLRERSDHA